MDEIVNNVGLNFYYSRIIYPIEFIRIMIDDHYLRHQIRDQDPERSESKSSGPADQKDFVMIIGQGGAASISPPPYSQRGQTVSPLEEGVLKTE
jgi:hypothetical protein